MSDSKVQKELKLSTGAGKSKNLQQVGQILGTELTNLAKPIRKDLDNLAEHFIKVEDLINEGAKLAVGIDKLLYILDNFMSIQGGDAQVSAKGGTRKAAFGSGLESAFNEVKREVKSLFDGRFFNGKDFGHQDITPSGIRLAGLAVTLQKMEDFILNQDKRKTNKNTREKLTVPTNMLTLKNQSIKGLREAKKTIQTMLIASHVVENMPHNISLTGATDKYAALVSEFNKLPPEEILTLQKNKYFNVLNGKVGIELKVESKSYNKYKNFYQSAFGTNASALLNKQYSNPQIKKHFLDKVDIGELTGSPSISGKIVKDLSLIAIGKKPTSSNHKGSASSTSQSAKGSNKRANLVGKMKALESAGKKAKAKARKKTTKKKDTEKQSNLGDLSKLEMLINKRLPAEVRRQMGRPALINRTGRFSNSVKVEGLRPTAKGISADYTYQLSPYETFENTGSKRWPVGYNPKLLITKSIRTLALAYTEKKLVSLRRK